MHFLLDKQKEVCYNRSSVIKILEEFTDNTGITWYHYSPENPTWAEERFSITYYKIKGDSVKVPEFIIEKAKEEALKSDHKQKVSAIIFNKGTIYSIGRNYTNKSAKHIHPKFLKYPTSIHAEVDAIIHARRDIKGYSILVIRVNNKKELRLAKPCKNCLTYIDFCGMKDIYYSTNEGKIERMKI